MSQTAAPAKGFALRDLAFIGLFAVLIAVCSWITIPGAVPFTLQTFGVFCTLGMLGGRRGTCAILVYILLGIVGIPVFSGFTGGIGQLLGMTGGYILGFLLMGLLYWLMTRLAGSSLPVMILAMVLGLAVCYTFGTIWFLQVYTRQKGAITIMAALWSCVFPFLIPDGIKLALALLLTKRLTRQFRI